MDGDLLFLNGHHYCHWTLAVENAVSDGVGCDVNDDDPRILISR